MVATKEKDEKAQITYLEDIITMEESYENNKINISEVPVFRLEGCEVLFSSLSSKTPRTGHSIRLLFPDNNFYDQDKKLRNAFLVARQENFPDMENYKGCLKKFVQKDFLDGRIEEAKIGRSYIDINVTNTAMYDRVVDEDGKYVDTRIQDAKSSQTGNVVVKYFRTIDRYTGKGVNPLVFKYNENGDRVTTFVKKNTSEELPLYLSAGDIVNIELRPYEAVSRNDKSGNTATLKYNLLSVELVQTAWDRGIGKKSGSSNVKESQDSLEMSSLRSIFAGLSTGTTSSVSVSSTPVQTQVAQTVSTVQNTPTNNTVTPTQSVEVPWEQPVVQNTTTTQTVAVAQTQNTTQTPVQAQPVENVIASTVETQPTATTQTNEVQAIDFGSLLSDIGGISL